MASWQQLLNNLFKEAVCMQGPFPDGSSQSRSQKQKVREMAFEEEKA